jgi:hypothetical protein
MTIHNQKIMAIRKYEVCIRNLHHNRKHLLNVYW